MPATPQTADCLSSSSALRHTAHCTAVPTNRETRKSWVYPRTWLSILPKTLTHCSILIDLLPRRHSLGLKLVWFERCGLAFRTRNTYPPQAAFRHLTSSLWLGSIGSIANALRDFRPVGVPGLRLERLSHSQSSLKHAGQEAGDTINSPMTPSAVIIASDRSLCLSDCLPD